MGTCPTRLVDALRAALAGRSDVDLALLFGSRARGDEHAGSDVDVAVMGEDIDAATLAAELSVAVGLEVDVVPLTDPGVPLLQRLVDEAIVVHEGSPGAAASWRTASLLALEIDGPWYRRMRDAFLARVAERGVQRVVDPDLVAAKLVELDDRVQRVREHRPVTSDELETDRDKLDIVSFNLMLAVQAVGLRNVVAQGYVRVDVPMVHRAATDGLNDLVAFFRQVARWVEERAADQPPA